MKLIDNKITKILFISTLSCFICISCLNIEKTKANQQITVDVTQVIADVSNNPVGMNLNFLLDQEAVTIPSKELKIGSLRYPMGEIADYYLFNSNNPTQPKISIRDTSLWFSSFTNSDGTWKNLLNFDKFISICRSINAEPFVVIGIDALAYQGDSLRATPKEVLQAAVDWVKYANITKKYHIKHWEIGNEIDLPNAHLNWTAEKYAKIVVQFAQAMKQVDPSIEIGANGMTGSVWWDKVMPIVRNDVDFLVTHQYSSMNSYEQWSTNNWNYTHNLETAKKTIETYKPNLKLNVTESSSFNPSKSHANNIWKMLHNFEMIGNILSFNKVDYFHFWISRWFAGNPYSIDASVFNSNYELMPIAYPLKIWGNFIKQQIVFSTKQLDKVRSWASYDPDDGSLNLFLLNKDMHDQKIGIKINNYKAKTNPQRWILQGKSPYKTKPVWQKVTNSEKVENSKMHLKLKPLSINVITFDNST